MEVRLVSNPNRVFHLPSDIAELLCLWPGSPIEKVPPPAPPRVPRTKWSVSRTTAGDSAGTLYIHGHCETCRTDWNVWGDKVTQKFWHCGIGEPVPPEIIKQYDEVSKQGKKLSATERNRLALLANKNRVEELNRQIFDGNSGETDYTPSDPGSL